MKPALLAIDAFGQSGTVAAVDLLYYSSDSAAPPSVTLHEDLREPPLAKRCRIRLHRVNPDKLWRVYLNFQYQDRIPGIFGIRLDCLSSVNGCETPEALLPTLPDLQVQCVLAEPTSPLSGETH